MVTQQSTGVTVQTLTTTDQTVTVTSLSCCEEYDFTVTAGRDGIPVTHRSGFRTAPDLSGEFFFINHFFLKCMCVLLGSLVGCARVKNVQG